MVLYKGNRKIKEVYVGSTPIKEIYKGNELVYQKTGNLNPDACLVGETTLNDVLSTASCYVENVSSSRTHYTWNFSYNTCEVLLYGKKYTIPAGTISAKFNHGAVSTTKWINSTRYLPIRCYVLNGAEPTALAIAIDNSKDESGVAIGNSLKPVKIYSDVEPDINNYSPNYRHCFWYDSKNKVMRAGTVSSGVYSWNTERSIVYLGYIKCAFGSTINNMTYEVIYSNNETNWNISDE